MSLRQALQFHAFFTHVEGRQVMLMPRRAWERLNQLREGDIAKIDLSTTPIADVAHDSRIEAFLASAERRWRSRRDA